MSIIARGQVTLATVEDGKQGEKGVSVVYRGVFTSANAYYNNALRRDVVKRYSTYYIYKGADATAGVWVAANWEPFGAQFDSVATDLLLAENANIGGFIFRDGKLISQRGTVNGTESTDYTNAQFVPYITLDGTNGTTTIRNGEFYGGVRTLFYAVNSANCTSLGSNQFKVTDKLNLVAEGLYTEQLNILLPNDTSFIGKQVNIHNPVYALTRMSLMYQNATVVRAEEGYIYYKPFLGSQDDITFSGEINSTTSIEFMAGTLSFLCVPGQGGTVDAVVRWLCLNYPNANTNSGGTTSSGDVTASGSLTSNRIILGAGSKSIKASAYAIQTVLTNSSSYLPTSSAVKSYVDSAINAIPAPTPDETSSEWYNIFTRKDAAKNLYTIVENFDSRLFDSSTYRLVLLKYRKQHNSGRTWSVPMFPYVMYERGLTVAPPPNAISEANSWWRVTGNIVPWFNRTSNRIEQVISLASNEGAGGKWYWCNTHNKRMCIGVAIYKYTGIGQIGWHRVSNIAYVEFYKQNSPTAYVMNVRI